MRPFKNNTFILKENIDRPFHNDVIYNVIDDTASHYLKLKHWKELIGAQRDWKSNCKYGKRVQIKGGITTIFLRNLGLESSFIEFLDKSKNSSLKEWTHQNAQFEFINSPIYTLQRDQTDTTMTIGVVRSTPPSTSKDMDSWIGELITALQAENGIFIWQIWNPIYFKIGEQLERPFTTNCNIILV